MKLVKVKFINIIVALPLLLTDCDGNNKSRKADNSDECKSDCESNLWPRLIVGIIPPEGVEVDGSELVNVSVVYPDGENVDGIVHGCPVLPEGIFCTFSFFASPNDEKIKVTVDYDNNEKIEKEIKLAPHNYCGREIAYVVVILDEEEQPVFKETEYISPCEALSL
jgi:hypothetical protein